MAWRGALALIEKTVVNIEELDESEKVARRCRPLA